MPGDRERQQDGEEQVTNRHKEFLGLMAISTILVVVTLSEIHRSKLKLHSLLHVNYTTIKLLKIKENIIIKQLILKVLKRKNSVEYIIKANIINNK